MLGSHREDSRPRRPARLRAGCQHLRRPPPWRCCRATRAQSTCLLPSTPCRWSTTRWVPLLPPHRVPPRRIPLCPVPSGACGRGCTPASMAAGLQVARAGWVPVRRPVCVDTRRCFRELLRPAGPHRRTAQRIQPRSVQPGPALAWRSARVSDSGERASACSFSVARDTEVGPLVAWRKASLALPGACTAACHWCMFQRMPCAELWMRQL